MNTTDLARRVRELVIENKLEDALNLLYRESALGKEHLDYVTILLARLNRYKENRLRLGEDPKEWAHIASAILDLLKEIAPPTAAPPAPQTFRKGKLLHDIPEKMKIGECSECHVRIALNKKHLLKNYAPSEFAKIEDLEKVADVMEVHLESPEEGAFTIKSANKYPEQFIEEDAASSWLFYVWPLKTDRHKLTLKVVLRIEKDGVNKHREVVLSRDVYVQTQTVERPEKWEEVLTFGETGLASWLLGGLFRRENRKVALSTSLAVVATVVFALMPPNAIRETWEALRQWAPISKSWPEKTLRIYAPTDSAMLDFRASGAEPLANRQILPGVWDIKIRPRTDPAKSDFAFLFVGPHATHRWQLNGLPADTTHLFVLDSTTQPIFVRTGRGDVDTFFGRFIVDRLFSFPAYKLYDDLFWVPLSSHFISGTDSAARGHEVSLKLDSNWCHTPEYQSVVLYAKDTLHLPACDAVSPDMHFACSVALSLSPPVAVQEIRVNGHPIASFQPDEKKDALLQFKFNRVRQRPDTIEVRAANCDCDTLIVKPNKGNIVGEITCCPKEKPPKPKKDEDNEIVRPAFRPKVTLKLDKHYAAYRKFLQVHVDGEVYYHQFPESLSVSLRLDRLPQKRTITVEHHDEGKPPLVVCRFSRFFAEDATLVCDCKKCDEPPSK